MSLILGTRGSALALAQARLVQAAFRSLAEPVETELRVIKTTGDQRMDLRLAESNASFEKGLFTKELEEALLNHQIDLAIHSLKDLPTQLPEGCALAGVLPREDPADVLVSVEADHLTAVPIGGVIATSSPRRAHQLRQIRSDLKIREIRGNVATRIEKLIRHPEWSGLILALAGLRRLGLIDSPGSFDFRGSILHASKVETMVPAAGQGAIAMEIALDRPELAQTVALVNHAHTFFAVRAERSFLRLIGGGCQLPNGVHGRYLRESFTLAAMVSSEDHRTFEGEVSGRFGSPEEPAELLWEKIYGR